MTSSYTRFIILSNARTGSNLVQQSLNSHPSVVCFRELFNLDPDYIDYDRDGWDGHDAGDLALRAHDIEAFLETRIFGVHDTRIRAVGFKFHYDHFWHDQKLVPLLTAGADLRVIHLKRLNRLRTLVSTKIAEQTGEWMQHDAAKQRRETIRRKLSVPAVAHAAVHPIESAGRLRRFLRPAGTPAVAKRAALSLTYEECIAFFYKVGHEEEHFARLFADHPLLEITYERLVEDRSAVIGEACAFLGVEYATPSTTLRRQNPEPLRELIANYDELRAAFASTPEEAFFDD